MKQLKICRRMKDRFTVVVTIQDYGAFAYYGTFPDISYYYRIDTEDELISLLKQGDELSSDEIEIIYYGNLDVTDKYIKHEDEQ